MTFTAVTLHTPDIASYGAHSAEALRRYAERHGYGFILHTDTLDPSRPPAWSKLLAAKRALPSCDWCFWLDADAVVCNHETRLDEFVGDGCIMLASTGATNSGSMLLRNCPDTVKMLDMMWNHTSTLNERVWDDGAAHVLQRRDPWFKSMFHIDQRIQTPYLEFRKGDFVCHMMGQCRQLRDMVIPRIATGDFSIFK